MSWPYVNFSIQEIACPCCGDVYCDPKSMATLQRARTLAKVPFKINSAHRCVIHNANVGGAPRSMHKKLAFDISVVGRDRHKILKACREAGFTGFGYYHTFLHVDLGRPRFWYSRGAKSLWRATE